MSSDNNYKKSIDKKNKKINIRRYINCLLMMVCIILIAFIASKMYDRYKENKLGESVFTRFVGTVQYDDLDSALNEMSTDSFVFISYVKSEETKTLEVELKKSIEKNNLASNFYYLDATDLMLDKDFIDNLNKKLNLKNKDKIETLPALLYYNDGKFMKTITSTKDRKMTADDFNKMLDSYEIIDKN